MFIRILFILRVFYLILLGSVASCETKVRTFRISVGLVYCNEWDLIKANRIVADLNLKQSLDLKTQIVIDIVGKYSFHSNEEIGNSILTKLTFK